MSAQFGRWSFDSKPTPVEELERVAATITPYGPDFSNSHFEDGVSILWRAFYTTRESRGEVQPYICRSGAVLTWDGRLDLFSGGHLVNMHIAAFAAALGQRDGHVLGIQRRDEEIDFGTAGGIQLVGVEDDTFGLQIISRFQEYEHGLLLGWLVLEREESAGARLEGGIAGRGLGIEAF